MKRIYWLIILSASFIFSQVNFKTHWISQFYGPDSISFVNDIVVDDSSNVYILGTTFSQDNGDDIFVVKYDVNGKEKWNVLFNGSTNSWDTGSSITIDNLGDILVSGNISNQSTYTNILLAKMSRNGVLSWKYNGSDSLYVSIKKIVIDNSNNIFLTGKSNNKVSAFKFDASGKLLWEYSLDKDKIGFSQVSDIEIDDKSNVYITGMAWNDSVNNYDIFLSKIDSSGLEIFAHLYNGIGNNDDNGLDLIVDKDNILITGKSSDNNNYTNFITLKLNSNGIIKNELYFDDTDNEDSFFIALDSQKNIYVCGRGKYATDYDIVLVKYDNDASFSWMRRFNGTGNGWDEARGLSIDSSDRIIVTGTTWTNNRQGDFITLAYDADGNLLSKVYYDNMINENDGADDIFLDKNGDIYVTGLSYIDNINHHVTTTIKYGLEIPSLINAQFNSIPKTIVYQNYPNPFNPITTIEYELETKSDVKIYIYDISGRKVKTLVNQNQNSGKHSVTLDASDLASGVYIYKLNAGSFEQSRKMLLVR